MSSEIAALEADVKEYQIQLDTVLESLKADPENVELGALQDELGEAIALTRSAIADLKPASTLSPAIAPRSRAASPPAPEKWSKENHPAFQPGFRKSAAPLAPEETHVPVTFKVNDTVLAKWLAGDKAFYPARITSITGYAASPVYIVNFKADGTSETLRSGDIRPMASNNAQKRKADGTPVSTTPIPPPPPNPNVISAAANINPDLAAQVKKEPSKVSDGPTRPPKVAKKIKANKELEAGKNKWQDFASRGKMAKAGKKESMFRTGESATARVGFTGSGQAMRKDPTRSRHIYQEAEDGY